MLPTIWQGLAQKSSLTKLTVKFSTGRHPRPVTLVPPIPNLEYLHVFDIDPLCYIDDISLLLLGSKKLRDLKLHWSPRMRQAHEPSTHQSAYWGRCSAAQYSMPLRSIAIQNLYSRHDPNTGHVVDHSTLQEVTFLNSTAGLEDPDGATAFIDNSWRKSDECLPTQLKSARFDKVSRQQCDFISRITGLEKLYLIGPHVDPRATTPFPRSPASNSSSPSSTDISKLGALKDEYISAITRNHGSTLKNLLLLPQWRLTNDDIATIVRHCPKLEQLGIGVEVASFEHLRLLMPFLSNLTSLRLLANPDDPAFVHTMREYDEQGLHTEKIGQETVNAEWSRLKYLELGADDMIFELGERALVSGHDKHCVDKEYCANGGKHNQIWRRPVKRRKGEDLKHIDIWKMDSLDL